MGFQNPILGGVYLVRESIRSPNYVPGVSGWTINQDGSAEFHDIDMRGEFSTGDAPSPRILISDSVVPPFPGVPRMMMWSGHVDETLPAILANYDVGSHSELLLFSSGHADDRIGIVFASPTPLTPGGIAAVASLDPSNVGWFVVDNCTMFVGSPALNNLLIDGQNHVIQAQNNGVEQPLSLQENGGNLLLFFNSANATDLIEVEQSGKLWIKNGTNGTLAVDPGLVVGHTAAENIFIDYDTIQARDNGATNPLLVNPFGGGVEIPDLRHQSTFNNGGVGENTSSTSYVAMATATGMSINNPASSTVTVAIDCTLQSTGVAGASARLSYQFRQTNAAGAIITAANDDWSVVNIQPNVFIHGASVRTHTVTSPSGIIYVEMVRRSSSAAATAAFQDCNLTVMPSP